MQTGNQFRETLEKGDTVFGAGVKSFSPAIIEILGDIGLDFAWVDFEHGGPSPWDSTLLENLTRAAEVADIELLVRVPTHDPFLIRKVLDSGVRNILLPRIRNPDQVKQVVRAGRFSFRDQPGDRGAALGRARGYGSTEDYYLKEDREVCVGVLIEMKESIENLSDILSVPELGFVYIGPGDLALQMGYDRQKDRERLEQTIDQIVEASNEADVPIGRTFRTTEEASEATNKGYRIIRLGDDFDATKQTFKKRFRPFSNTQ